MASTQLRLVVLGALVVSGCSPSGASTPMTSIPPAEVRSSTTQMVVPTAAPEPTGVPGLSAADPFCAAWAGFAGTLQALGVAASFGDLRSDRLAALELSAAPRLVEFTAAIEASWPPELATEQVVVIEHRVGPYARRAQRGVDALRAAGVTAAELGELSSAWQTSLSERDPRVAVIELPAVADELQAKLDASGRAFDKAVTPFAQDPSLVVDNVDTPVTDEYLSVHCPDLASIGVGDAL